MKKITSICLLFLSINFCFSQEKNRIEFDLREDYENYQFTPVGENGFLVYSKKTEKKPTVQTWKIEQYSTDLELLRFIDFEVPLNHKSLQKHESDDYLILVFSDFYSGNFTVFRIDNKNLKIEKETGSSLKKLSLLNIEYQHPVVSILAYGKKVRYLLTVDFESGAKGLNSIQINGIKDKNIRIQNFESIESTKEIIVFVNTVKGKRITNLYGIKFSNEGVRNEVINFGDQVNKNLNSISTTAIDDNEYVYVGSYSSGTSMSNEGIYFAHSLGNKISFIKYYSFVDFEDFFKYLPQKQQNKIEKKKNKKNDRGKELVLSYRMASHKMIELNKEFYYIGESYYPTYRTETYTTYQNGRPVTQTRQVFDGYQYTHATLCKFNKEGEKIWDRTFTMYPSYKPFVVKRFIKSSFENDLINLVFTSRNAIVYKSFTTDGEIINDRKVDFIKTDSESDKIKFSSATTVYWYGKYFISYGSQTIKDKDEKIGNKKRVVYFINKIPF